MENVTSALLDFFGIATVPTDFPSFMFWLCSLIAGLCFVKMVLVSVFGMIRDARGITR